MKHRPPSLSIVALLPIMIVSTASSSPDFSAASAVLREAVAERAFPGCSAIVGTSREVLWQEAIGGFDYDDTAPVERGTIYDLASLTKVVGTTATAMRLVANEKLHLDRPVVDYLPELGEGKRETDRSRKSTITVRHLLHHTAGFPAWRPFFRSVDGYDALLEAALDAPLDSEPGASYRYSDIGFLLLGEVLARAGGKTLPELEQELIFTPLGMSETRRNPPSEVLPRIPPTERWPEQEDFIRGVVHDENARAGEGVTGHAGLFAPAADLASLARELLLGLEGESALFPRPVMEMFVGRESEDSNRGLGWALASGADSGGRLISRRAFGHTGFTGTSIWIDPERDLFLILLTNRVHPTRDNPKIGQVRSRFADAVIKAVDEAREAGRPSTADDAS